MPIESIAPLLMAIALFIFFGGVVYTLLWVALAGLISSVRRRLFLALASTAGATGMSTTVNVYQKTGKRVVEPVDEDRGTVAMFMVIGTELALFVSLFCSLLLYRQ